MKTLFWIVVMTEVVMFLCAYILTKVTGRKQSQSCVFLSPSQAPNPNPPYEGSVSAQLPKNLVSLISLEKFKNLLGCRKI